MKVEHIEVLVEEPSAEALLTILLPKLVEHATFTIHVHQGKKDLLAKLPAKLRAYRHWLPASHRILVLVDRDDSNCVELKSALDQLALDAGLSPRSKRAKRQYAVLNRLAIEELEAWYFGDWNAVRSAYPRAASNISVQTKYRHPDKISGGTWEAFQRCMQAAGYYKTGLRKIEVARSIAPHMDVGRNTSESFRALCSALAEMT